MENPSATIGLWMFTAFIVGATLAVLTMLAI